MKESKQRERAEAMARLSELMGVLSTEEIMDACGVCAPLIYKWRKQMCFPNGVHLNRFCEHFKVSVGYILNGTEAEKALETPHDQPSAQG